MSDKKCVLYISHSAGMGGAEQSLLNALKIIHHYIRVIVVLPDKGKLFEKNTISHPCGFIMD